MTRERVTILGATGSVGRSTLNVLASDPARWSIDTVTAHRDVAGLADVARRCSAKLAVIADEGCHAALVDALEGSGVGVASGREALIEAATRPVKCVVAAIVGNAGLPPVWAAAGQGARIALANKEALVCAGELLRDRCRQSGATLLPVDSEHSAIWQCFDFARPERVGRVVLTASGGPFRGWTREQMATVTPSQAVAHPNWSMGAKISVDSATLMNKGLELIEAWHLFPVRTDQLATVVHPQSIVHSFVEYVDGSVLAQMGAPDMRTPIAVALAWPDRLALDVEAFDLVGAGSLTFEEPDEAAFPALTLARSALDRGGSLPVVLNAANEVAVAAFLDGRLRFLDIAAVVADAMAADADRAPTSLEEVEDLDARTRGAAAELVTRRSR